MCELFTIGTAVITVMDVIGVAMAAASAAAAMQQAQAKKDEANFQSAVARNNQIMAESQAYDLLLIGREEEREHNEQVSAFKGRQRSLLAGGGFEANSEDALDILGATAEQGKVGALTIRSNAERKAWEVSVGAANLGAEALFLQSKADNISPGASGAFAFGQGMATVGSRWSQRNPNAFKSKSVPNSAWEEQAAFKQYYGQGPV